MTPRPHLKLLRKPVAPPMERVTHLRWPSPPTDYSRNVQARWDAILATYNATRNRESTVLPWRGREAGVASIGGGK